MAQLYSNSPDHAVLPTEHAQLTTGRCGLMAKEMYYFFLPRTPDIQCVSLNLFKLFNWCTFEESSRSRSRLGVCRVGVRSSLRFFPFHAWWACSVLNLPNSTSWLMYQWQQENEDIHHVCGLLLFALLVTSCQMAKQVPCCWSGT